MGTPSSEKPAVSGKGFDPAFWHGHLYARLVDEAYNGRTLSRVLLKKFARRVLGRKDEIGPVFFFGGLVLFDHPSLHMGGLIFGQDFSRVLHELGFHRCERLFEFCAGPGYIGYELFAHGFCEKLTLSDINPLGALAARKTARFNDIEDRVNIYVSDGLRQIPPEEKWDLVVSNPPLALPRNESEKDIRQYDPDWRLHKHFYSSVMSFMKPQGHVVMLEIEDESQPEIFTPMIQTGGGKLMKVHRGADVGGRPNGLYYVVSEW